MQVADYVRPGGVFGRLGQPLGKERYAARSVTGLNLGWNPSGWLLRSRRPTRTAE